VMLNGLMRKTLLTLLIIAVAVALSIAASESYVQKDNARQVKRAQELVSALERLEIGKSDHEVADAIAAKFGNAPPAREFRGHYNKENCAAPDRYDSCTYIIPINGSTLQGVLLKHHILPHLGVRGWFGTALVSFSGGTVSQYYFRVWYEASDGNWRAFAATVGWSLPRDFEFPQVHVSDSYSVRRIDMGMGMEGGVRGLGLQSALTPAANADERTHALHINFGCLALRGGCGETCEVMPEAWRDYYEKLGHSEVEKLGLSCLLCGRPPT
jgi:hypothetical protein